MMTKMMIMMSSMKMILMMATKVCLAEEAVASNPSLPASTRQVPLHFNLKKWKSAIAVAPGPCSRPRPGSPHLRFPSCVWRSCQSCGRWQQFFYWFHLGLLPLSGLPGCSPPSPHLTTASSCHGNRAVWGGNCRCGSRPGHHWHCQGPLPGAAEDGHLPRVHAQLSSRAGSAGGRGRAGTRLD